MSAALAAVLLAAQLTRARYLMGTVCEITAGDAAQIDAAFDEAARIESMISTWRDDSELSRLNSGKQTTVSPELMQILYDVLKYRDYTSGAFDPLVGPLLDVWQIRGRGAVPSPQALAEVMRRVHGPNPVFYGRDVIALQNGAKFEEGAFGKGYALDRMLAKIQGEAVINFGGQLALRGRTTVTVADPEHRDRAIIAFSIDGGSLSTSSGSEHTFEAGGKRFSHIVDPRSGEALPPRGSVSVIDVSAFRADIFSTALYVMGIDEGMRWATENGVAALFVAPGRHIRMTPAFRGRIKDLNVIDSSFVIKE